MTSPTIHSNESEAAEKISQAFSQGAVAVSLFGQMQSGKTNGLLKGTQNWLQENNKDVKDSVLFLTGYSDTRLKQQFTGRACEFFQCPSSELRVYHRNDLQSKKVVKVLNCFTGLVVVDESHVASEKDCVLTNALQSARLLDLDYLRATGSKLLLVSATPGAVLHQLQSWGPEAHQQVQMIPGDGYVGVGDLISQNRVLEPENIDTDPQAVVNLLNLIVGRWGPSNPRNHVLRSNRINSLLTVYLHDAAQQLGLPIQIHLSDSKNNSVSINERLTTVPTVHTFIIIKDFLRCGHNLPKQHIGVLYECHVNSPDCQTVVQGLLGRACGYEHNPDLLVYADIDSAREWLNFLDNGLSFTSPYTSRLIKVSSEGVITSKESLAHPTVADLGVLTSEALARLSLQGTKTNKSVASKEIDLLYEECKELFQFADIIPKRGLCWMPDREEYPSASYGAMVLHVPRYMNSDWTAFDFKSLKKDLKLLYQEHLPPDMQSGAPRDPFVQLLKKVGGLFDKIDFEKVPCSAADYTKPMMVSELLGKQIRKDAVRGGSHHHPLAYCGSFNRDSLCLLSQFTLPWKRGL